MRSVLLFLQGIILRSRYYVPLAHSMKEANTMSISTKRKQTLPRGKRNYNALYSKGCYKRHFLNFKWHSVVIGITNYHVLLRIHCLLKIKIKLDLVIKKISLWVREYTYKTGLKFGHYPEGGGVMGLPKLFGALFVLRGEIV